MIIGVTGTDIEAEGGITKNISLYEYLEVTIFEDGKIIKIYLRK